MGCQLPQVTLIAMLDKQHPFSHSFVDGMLGKVVGRSPQIVTWLLVSRGSAGGKRPYRHFGAACMPLLLSRRGPGRFINIIYAFFYGRRLARRAKLKGHRVALFVRNDPALLLGCSFLRGQADRLVFQSSFPHEDSCEPFIKRATARVLYFLSRNRVDAITAVSPLGLERLKKIFPNAKAAEYIPLLADLPGGKPFVGRGEAPVSEVVRFVYIGAHSKDRQLDVVLRGIVHACVQGLAAEFTFVGGTETQIAELSATHGVDGLLRSGKFRFVPAVSRSEVAQILFNNDVGLSLIPPIPLYHEASPTKLAEYMAAGLAIVASRGIALQERFIEASGAGLLVDWHERSISEALHAICVDSSRLMEMRSRSRAYAWQFLQYSSFFPSFKILLGDECLGQA